jgi:hypothetical protein
VKRFVAVVISLPVLLAVAGCGSKSPSTGESGGPSIAHVDESWFSSGGQGAFQPLPDMGTNAEQRLEGRSEQVVTACMAKRGFAYQAEISSGAVPPENPYSTITPAEEKAGSYYRAPESGPSDPNAFYVNSLSPAERQAWSGALLGTGQSRTKVQLPSGAAYTYVADSCVARAAADVLGAGFQGAYLAVQDLAGIVATRTLADPQVRAAIAVWVSCVAQEGLGPVARLDDLRAMALKSTVVDVSAHAFAVDLACEQSSDVRNVLFTTQRIVERAVAREMPEALIRLGSQPAIDGDAAQG